jgi:hypothetical protein
VQIFQDEHQRAGGGEHLQRFGELPQHAGWRDAAGQGIEALPVLGGEQGREVYKPARRILPQHGDEMGAIRSPAEASQGLQHGQIGLPRPIVVDALAVPDPDVLDGAHWAIKASTRAVLPMPGSPTTMPTWRRPCCAVVHHCSSWASSAPRPTKSGGWLIMGASERDGLPSIVGRSGGSTALTGAMNR